MIGKSSWFSPRKYGGWGLTPNCWQGWLYVVIAVLPFVLIKNTPVHYFWLIVVSLDFVDIMLHLKKDERETLHEALAERNALWVMILILVAGSFIQKEVNPIVVFALIGSTIAKALTHFHLRDK